MTSRRDWQLQQLGITQWSLRRPGALQGEIAISIPAHVRLVMVAAQLPALTEPLISDILRALTVSPDQVLQLTPDRVAMLPQGSRCNSWRLGTEEPLLLEGIPMYTGTIRGELCTPTGAALLRHFVTKFAGMPVMRVEKIGYGLGTKDFEAANALRVMLGNTEEAGERILSLACNLDDMTGEDIAFAAERILQAGALDVFTTPIGMKKNRPGVLLSVLCRAGDREKMARLIFRHTTTLGIRESLQNRYTLERRTQTLSTPYGAVRQKISSGYGVQRQKAEYEDIAVIAREQGLSIAQVREILK